MIASAPFADLLEKVVDNRGKTCPTASTGTPLIATNCVKESTLFPVFEKVRYVDDTTMATWFRGHPQPGDILFVCKGSPGQTCLVPDPVDFCIAQDMVAVRADSRRIYPPYLFAALRSSVVQNQIANMHVGTMIPHFKKGDFDKLFIPLPDDDTQIAIGDLYLSLSQKIELNRRMNETLEAQARALFRDWFVDFGPVKAKIAGDAPYLAPELWSLFPNRLGEDGVPEGWSKISVGDVADLRGGKQLAKTEIAAKGPVPVFGGAGIMGYTERENANGYVITVGRVGAYCGQFFAHRGPTWVNNNASLIKPKENVSPEWLFLALKELDIGTIKKGAAQPFVSNGDIAKLPLVQPASVVMEAFLSIVCPLIHWQESSITERDLLTQTRDLLLPKLMSGEIRVGEAEKALAAA